MRPRISTAASIDYNYGGAYYGDAGAGYGGSVSPAMSAPPEIAQFQATNGSNTQSSSAGMLTLEFLSLLVFWPLQAVVFPYLITNVVRRAARRHGLRV